MEMNDNKGKPNLIIVESVVTKIVNLQKQEYGFSLC